MKKIYFILLAIFVTLIMGCIGDDKKSDLKDDLLWEYDVTKDNQTISSVAISPNGDDAVITTMLSESTQYKTYFFGKNGTLVWEKSINKTPFEKEPDCEMSGVCVKSCVNHGAVVSDDGKYVAVVFSCDIRYFVGVVNITSSDNGERTNSSYDILLFNKTGGLLWKQNFEEYESGGYSTISIKDNKVFLVTASKITYIFDINGALREKTKTRSDHTSFQVAEDGSYVASGYIGVDNKYYSGGGTNNLLVFFDGKNNTNWTYKIDDDIYLTNVIISKDGRHIIATAQALKGEWQLWNNPKAGIYIWDRNGKLIKTLHTLGEIAISDDGKYLVVGSDKLYFFEINNSKYH